MRALALVAIALVVAACGAGSPAPTAIATQPNAPDRELFPAAPPVPDGPFSDAVVELLDRIWSGLPDDIDIDAIAELGEAGDVRVAWLLADLLRFGGGGDTGDAIRSALHRLTGITFTEVVTWVPVTDHLIAWDTPVPAGYLDYKRALFTLVDPRWEFVFDEPNAIDERILSWGGVLIDDRPRGATEPCPRGCIPALDDPAVTPAADGSWYPDDAIVFGVVVADEARAYPKHIMETHEMVNDTLGGRRIGVPYCTLCGSAQAYLLDDLAGFDELVLRTTGLLSRSNKVMYELGTESVFDTFTGRAVAGPMFEAEVELTAVTVVTSTWGAWRSAHPDTTIVASDGGIGRVYDPDPLGGRDDEGPIFPIGDRDLSLPLHTQVLGVETPEGTTIAFPVERAAEFLADGGTVAMGDVTVSLDGGGLVADFRGRPIATHQAFWFAWSQFHPDTELWNG